MLNYLIDFIKIILVGVNLKFRTILSRLYIYQLSNFLTKIKVGSHIFNPQNIVFSDLSVNDIFIQPDVFFFNDSIKVLDSNFKINEFLDKLRMDKNDYLHYYTFFYLNWEDLNVKLSENNFFLLKKIMELDVSKQPFVISQQAFNLILKGQNRSIYQPLLKNHYINLKKSIEYSVDGNHVLENFISLVLLEIYFFQKIYSIKKLYKEIVRQTRNDYHVEKNLKYAIDLTRKLRILLSIDIFNSCKYVNYKNDILNILKKWDENSFLLKNKFPVVHDNIEGDLLGISYFEVVKPILSKDKNAINFFKFRPYNGFRGHSFDVNFMPAYSSEIFSFGTISYANNNRRNFQRMRVNNVQPCFTKNDKSMFFWKSFRHLFTLPSFLIKNNSTIYFTEFLYSNGFLKTLFYKISFTKNGFTFSTFQNIKLRFWCENYDTIEVNKIQIGKTLFEIVDGYYTVNKSLRASGIDKYVTAFKIDFNGKKFRIINL